MGVNTVLNFDHAGLAALAEDMRDEHGELLRLCGLLGQMDADIAMGMRGVTRIRFVERAASISKDFEACAERCADMASYVEYASKLAQDADIDMAARLRG